MAFTNKAILLAVFVLLCLELCQSRVLELDDRFREGRKSGEWLVMFYAPWCGHCKQLEPTWMEIGDAMEGRAVNVARLDCTVHSSLSGEYGVRGFPTIKFISGGNDYEYRGARTKQDIMRFVEKARGPKVQVLDNSELIEAAQKKHDVFFLYVGDGDTHLQKSYVRVAEKLFLTINFYLAPSIAFSSVEAPTVLAFKDGAHHKMPLSAETVDFSQLFDWINSEQISDYSELTGISYHTLKQTKKLFAVAVSDNKDSKTIKSIAKGIALMRNELFHPKFVFCWVEGNGVINRMTYATVSAPNFVVFNPQNYEYYVLNSGEGSAAFGKKEINAFLTDVANGKISALGGSGFIQQIKRFFSDSTGMVINFFKESPIMASLVIGVPTFMISFLCYCLCTMEDVGEDEAGTDSEPEEEEDAEGLPEYQEEETEVRRRIVDEEEEPVVSEQAIGDASAETDKDK